jgi:hypothetical protein
LEEELRREKEARERLEEKMKEMERLNSDLF